MIIAIIGSGNVGSALAQGFVKAGHTVLIGAQFPLSEKSIKLATLIGEDRFNSIEGAVKQAEVIVLATPAKLAVEIAQSLGNTTGKVIIDTMNIVRGIGPAGFSNTTEAILANTQTTDVVKCFNTTGFENMLNPRAYTEGIDLFVAGNSEKGKQIATLLATEIGFRKVWDMGGNEQFTQIENLANVWINLAIFRKLGRKMGFKLVEQD